MHYAVTARFKPETAAEFLQRLSDGTIESQKPDGKEIVASMKRAKIGQDGLVRWSEICYCPTPLEHERETVLDHFFEDIETKEIEGHREFQGEEFWEYVGGLVE